VDFAALIATGDWWPSEAFVNKLSKEGRAQLKRGVQAIKNGMTGDARFRKHIQAVVAAKREHAG